MIKKKKEEKKKWTVFITSNNKTANYKPYLCMNCTKYSNFFLFLHS